MAKTTIGIIGDGQLGMLLCEAAPALALDTVMLTGDRRCAAAVQATFPVEGAMDEEHAVDALIDRCDVVTYEREDVPPAAVARLRAAEDAGRIRCFPPLSCIEMIQDKIRQKRWYEANDIATLPFAIVDGSHDALQEAAQRLGLPLVQKAPTGGFDGRGVQLLRSEEDFPRAWPGETLVEQYAGDFREIAVLVVRGRDGERRHFGPVDMTFEPDYSVLDTVSAPAMISSDIALAAENLAHDAIEAMGGVGVFGVEMFVLDNDRVLINEISPRVHNAGHYSLEACASSQFELHLRAVAGMPLVDTQLQRPAAMKNLLCTPVLKSEDRTREAGKTSPEKGTAVYWYGKSPARLMRKLGHVTSVADTARQALTHATARWQIIQDEAAKR